MVQASRPRRRATGRRAPGTICKRAFDPHRGADSTGGRVPDPHRPVAAGGGQPGAVRGDRHRPHRVGVAGEGGALLAGGRVPDPYRPSSPPAGQPGAVRGDRHRPYRAGVVGEGGALLAGGRVPDPYRPVVAAAGQPVPSGAIATALTGPAWPVRAARCWPVAGSQIRTVPSSPPLASQVPSGAIATAFTEPVCRRGGALLAGGRVPDPHRPSCRRGRASAVRGDRHRAHRADAPGEDSAVLAGQVPSGAIATALTEPVWPVVARCRPVAGSQIRTVVSPPAGQPGAVRGDRHALTGPVCPVELA